MVGGFISSRVKINITLEPEPCFYDLKERLESVSTELFYGKFEKYSCMYICSFEIFLF